jgi:hypothetical protein
MNKMVQRTTHITMVRDTAVSFLFVACSPSKLINLMQEDRRRFLRKVYRNKSVVGIETYRHGEVYVVYFSHLCFVVAVFQSAAKRQTRLGCDL